MGAEMEAAEEEIEQLRNELRLSRRKRALIPFLGDGLKWLFGTSTEKDTEKLHQEIKHVKTSIGKLHHITELQATLIGALSKEQTTNKRNIALLAKKSEELETTLFNVQQRNEWTMANIRREIDLNQVITSAIRTAGAAVMAFRHETQRICQAMADTQQGRVTPTILTPRDLKETLNSIKNHLPSGWTPAIGKTDTPAEIYSILDVAAIATVGGWEIHIQIPLEYQAYSDFLLYEVKSIPTHFINSSMAVETYTPTNYFAISNDQRLHIEASSQDIRHCKRLATKTICHKLSPLIQESREGCLYNAFRDNRPQADIDCTRKVVKTAPQMYAITDRKWVYALPREEIFTMQCADSQTATQGFRLQGTGIFSLPPGCAALGDNYIIPAHLKRNAGITKNFKMDDLTHFKISLNLTALFSRLPETKALNQTILKQIIETMPTSDTEDPLLTELKKKVQDWQQPADDDESTGMSIISQTSISLGSLSLLGLMILTIILCRRSSTSSAHIIQTPLTPVPTQIEPTSTIVLADLQSRVGRLEQAYQELKNDPGRAPRLEERLQDLQKKYDQIAPLL